MNTWERVLELNDPGHRKANELRRLEKEMTRHHQLMNDALVEGNDHVARFYDGIRFSLFTKWMGLKEA